MGTFEEAERRVRQIKEVYNPLIQQEREAEMEGKRLLEWRYDAHLATEITRAGAEAARLERVRDGKLEEVWKAFKDAIKSNNPGW